MVCCPVAANSCAESALSCRVPAQRQVSSRREKSAHNCKPHLAALFRVELGAAHIVFLDGSRNGAPVVVTVRKAVCMT